MLPFLAIGAIAGLAAGAAGVGLAARRRADERAEDEVRRQLAASGSDRGAFQASRLSDLPEPARRYFRYAIREGSPIHAAVEILMTGQLSLGGPARPNRLPMKANQILAAEWGFVWRLRAGASRLRFSGSDGYANGTGWTRFWLFGALPIVRAGGGQDFARSAAGRAVAEAAFWLPDALLPSESVRWSPLGPDSARVVVRHAGFEHQLDIAVDPDGRILSATLLRWSRENPARQWRLQPFGGTSLGVTEADGRRVASGLEGGNGFGTADYFPFYRAEIERVRFL